MGVRQEDLDEAERAVEEAEAALDAAEGHHAVVGSEAAAADVRYARGRAYNARDNVRRLRTVWAVEQQARVRRTAAEAAFSKKRGAVVERLAAGRDEAARAVAVLDRAAAEALRTVAAYSELVQSTAQDLLAAGLRHDDGGVEGGATDGSVHVGGEVWRPVSGPDLLGSLVSAAVAARDGRHPLGVKWRYSGGLVAQAGAEALWKAVER